MELRWCLGKNTQVLLKVSFSLPTPSPVSETDQALPYHRSKVTLHFTFKTFLVIELYTVFRQSGKTITSPFKAVPSFFTVNFETSQYFQVKCGLWQHPIVGVFCFTQLSQ